MLTDPIADFLTRIRNACRARKERVDIPYSKLKERLANVMIREGYIQDITTVGEGVERKIRLGLIYGTDHKSVITGLERRSKPSLRVYVGAAEAPRVRGGLGVSILSTPNGLITDREARAQKVGGEVLCAVW
ncbi:MAG: 30S ribosomal protein S8 [Deltaproteobacteria bacterium]